MPLASREISDLSADGQQTETSITTGQVAIAEEIPGAQRKQQLLARRGQSRTLALENLDRSVTLSTIHRFREGSLSRPRRTHVTAAKTRQLASATHAERVG